MRDKDVTKVNGIGVCRRGSCPNRVAHLFLRLYIQWRRLLLNFLQDGQKNGAHLTDLARKTECLLCNRDPNGQRYYVGAHFVLLNQDILVLTRFGRNCYWTYAVGVPRSSSWCD